MRENVSESISVTGRKPDELAVLHGYADIDALAADLPKDAKILDAGGGLSPFVSAIGERRPDVHAISVDACYEDPFIYKQLQAQSPPNVEYVTGDVTKLKTLFGNNTFHRVFSYWVFPHLSLYGRQPALQLAQGIWDVQMPNEQLSVGPEIGALDWRDLPRIRQRLQSPAMQITKTDGISQDEVVRITNQIVDRTQVPRSLKPGFIAWHEALAEVLGTNLHERKEIEGRRTIYDRTTDSYVLANSLTGLRIRSHVAQSALWNYFPAMRKASKD